MGTGQSTRADQATAVKFRVIIRDKAEADITEASVWYHNQQAGLGDEFLATVNTAIERATDNPYLYQRIRRRPDVRRILTRPFPYRIFFVLRPDVIVVFRVLHNARSDREWKTAIPNFPK